MSNELEPKFTHNELVYLSAREMGMTPSQAGAYAGFSEPSKRAGEMEAKPHIARKIVQIEHELRKRRKVTRQTVQDILIDAVDMAKILADPNAMIRAANELNKMHGFHAPEHKVIELSERGQRLNDDLEAMPEEEMLNLLEMDALDVEFTEIVEVPETED